MGSAREERGREKRENTKVCVRGLWRGHLGVGWEFPLPGPPASFLQEARAGPERRGGDMVPGEWEGDADCGAQRGRPLAPWEPQA